jgi:hypothetical protein
MKNIRFLFLLTVLLGCQSKNYVNDTTLTPSEWYDVLGQALLFSQNLDDNILIFNDYYNTEMDDMIQYVYGFLCEEYDIEYNKGISDFLTERTNSQASEELNFINQLDIEFVFDTASTNSKVFLLSEPLYFSPEMLGFSLSVNEMDQNEMKHWVFFYRKQEVGKVKLKLFAIYDYQIDDIYIDSNW